MRRIAIISDVHGNDVALRAVLADVAAGGLDGIVVAGDHVWSGPRPGEALTRLRGLGAPLLLGNTDAYLWLPDDRPSMGVMVPWVRGQIGEDGMATLRALPFSHRVVPPGGRSPDDDLLVVHATPTDNDRELVLQADPFGTHEVTPPGEARALVGGARAGLIVAGHLHFATAGEVDGQRMATVGSVGMSLDGDPTAAWGVATWDGARWELSHRRTPYDVAGVARDLEERCPVPAVGRVLAERLRQARWLPFA